MIGVTGLRPAIPPSNPAAGGGGGGGGGVVQNFDITGLTSHWKMDETSTGVAQVNRSDSYGTNTLTDVNTTASAAGKISNGANIVRANNENFVVAHNASLVFTGDFTIAAWINLTNVGANSTVFAKGDPDAAGGMFVLRFRAGVGMEFRVRDAANSTVAVAQATTFGILAATTWYHVMAWVTGGNAFCAVNGTANSAALAGGPYLGNTTDLYVGTYQAGTHRMNGIVDEVCVFKRAWSAAERTYMYNGGNGRTFTGTDYV